MPQRKPNDGHRGKKTEHARKQGLLMIESIKEGRIVPRL